MINKAPIQHFTAIDSTNLEARRLVDAGERRTLWIVADEQTGGRGRLGRKWQSPPGNLHATLLLPFDGPLTAVAQVGFAVALAVHDVVRLFAPGKNVCVKWPNDCLVDGGKVAGILCETLSHSPAIIAIGCGINIGSMPEGLPYPAARLADADVAAVFAAYQMALDNRLTQWGDGTGFSAIAQDWQDRAIGIGEIVTIADGGKSHSGQLIGLADDGAMLIELATGPQRFYAGDVTIPSLQKLRSSPA